VTHRVDERRPLGGAEDHGPSGFFESRTATTPGRFDATSTHCPPLPPERLDLRQLARPRSTPLRRCTLLLQQLGKTCDRRLRAERSCPQAVVHPSVLPDLVWFFHVVRADLGFQVDHGGIGRMRELEDRERADDPAGESAGRTAR
jgi:hypothetical protein